MKTYFIDANLLIRATLEDNEILTKKAKFYLVRAKIGEINLVLTSETVLEIEYVLRKTYKASRQKVAENLLTIVKSPVILVKEANILADAINIYLRANADLYDALLYLRAKEEGAEVLSFDKDFKKIEKVASL